MQKVIDIELLPQMLKSNFLNLKEATDCLLSFIYKNSMYLGIHKLNEDLKSEIYLYFSEKAENIFYRYNKELSTFKYYIKCSVGFKLMDILKVQYKKNLNTNDVPEQLRFVFDELVEQYDNDEAEIKFTSFKLYNENKFDNPPFAHKPLKIKKRPIDSQPPKNTKSLSEYFRLFDKFQAKLVLILALKSSWYLKDEEIDNICNYLNISDKEIIDSIQRIKDTLEKKNQKIKKAIEVKNKYYRMHVMLENKIQNSKGKRDTSFLEKQSKINNSKLKLQFEKLHDPNFYICPTNKNIAEELQISERLVGYYMQKAKEMYSEDINKES